VNPRPTYKVSKLERGTVLDHLRAGTALRALRVLALPQGATMTVGVNLQSGRLGRKDIVKIEAYELTQAEAAKVALLSPDATLSIIRDYQVVAKHDLVPPERFRGLIRCPNPACIVQAERIPASFRVESRDPVRVCCEYCERPIAADDFEFVE
jgi:aspartate carbamoyltransferase regulatory subunit